MPKLKKLLNQYLIEINRGFTINKRTREYRCFDDTKKTGRSIEEDKLISKQFGFIKWLVQHQKIDRYKDRYGMIFYEKGNQKYLRSYEELIMELSIQNEPVKFLVSLLK